MRIYPTQRAVLAMALGAPAAMAVALAVPRLWAVAALWILLVAALALLDVLLAASPGRVRLTLAAPRSLGLGRAAPAMAEVAFDGRAPRRVELAVGGDEHVRIAPSRLWLSPSDGRGEASFEAQAIRRGEGRLERIWARWSGPFGLVWLQHEAPAGPPVLVTPDVEGVRRAALRLFSREAPLGVKPLLDAGQGGDFHALREFQTGMDLRSIDWKQSARHGELLAREHHTERNHHIVLAIDTGRLMSAPTPRGARLDQAINAALLLAFVSLKMGDKAGLFAFDARPRIASGVVAGVQAFHLLQKLAAGIDYSTEETNFTLGLTSLSARLDRRALVVVFTDFADPTSAELMIENVGRLMRTHLVLFVVFGDGELDALAAAEPMEPDDISRAVIAGTLARGREVVIGRLERLGARIVRARDEDLGMTLVANYLDAKRRDLI